MGSMLTCDCCKKKSSGDKEEKDPLLKYDDDPKKPDVWKFFSKKSNPEAPTVGETDRQTDRHSQGNRNRKSHDHEDKPRNEDDKNVFKERGDPYFRLPLEPPPPEDKSDAITGKEIVTVFEVVKRPVAKRSISLAAGLTDLKGAYCAASACSSPYSSQSNSNASSRERILGVNSSTSSELKEESVPLQEEEWFASQKATAAAEWDKLPPYVQKTLESASQQLKTTDFKKYYPQLQQK